MEKNTLGGLCGCSRSPQTPREAVSAPTFHFCLKSLLLPLSLFQSIESQVNPHTHLKRCWTDGEAQDGTVAFPLPCPRPHIPACPQPWAAAPQHLLLPPTGRSTKAGPSRGPGDSSGLVWTQAGAGLSLPL